MYKDLDNIKKLLESLRDHLDDVRDADGMAMVLDALDATREAQESYAKDHWDMYLEEMAREPRGKKFSWEEMAKRQDEINKGGEV